MKTVEGRGDRMRVAAFAELQAIHCFRWAADNFKDEVPSSLVSAWNGLALAEEKHLHWLLDRMKELGIEVEERPVSQDLYLSLTSCKSARAFAEFMANAEERGRIAGERFRDALQNIDPISAKIFGDIAKEEVEHIELARRFFDFVPNAAIASKRLRAPEAKNSPTPAPQA